MSARLAASLIGHLWPTGDPPTAPQVYALLDGARDPAIEPMIRLSRLEYCCLYSGKLSPALESAAPYLVHLSPRSRFTSDFIERGWGRSWGMITVVPPDVTLAQQRRHFRTLLRVRDEHGRVLAFRFYDPRVLRTYLPTCTADQAAQVFGPVPSILVEASDPGQMIAYSVESDGIAARTIALTPAGDAGDTPPETANGPERDQQSSS